MFYTITFGETAILQKGITLFQALNSPIILTRTLLGDRITGRVTVIASGAGSAGWLELFGE